jgi:hypothetical protein
MRKRFKIDPELVKLLRALVGLATALINFTIAIHALSGYLGGSGVF